MSMISAPENELPGTWDASFHFVHDNIAVGIFGGFVYRSGFTFRVAARLNREPVIGSEFFDGITRWLADRPPVDGDVGLQLSITYKSVGGDVLSPGFRNTKGSGTGNSTDLDLWVSPLPAPTDAISIALEWPTFWNEPIVATFKGSDLRSRTETVVLWSA